MSTRAILESQWGGPRTSSWRRRPLEDDRSAERDPPSLPVCLHLSLFCSRRLSFRSLLRGPSPTHTLARSRAGSDRSPAARGSMNIGKLATKSLGTEVPVRATHTQAQRAHTRGAATTQRSMSSDASASPSSRAAGKEPASPALSDASSVLSPTPRRSVSTNGGLADSNSSDVSFDPESHAEGCLSVPALRRRFPHPRRKHSLRGCDVSRPFAGNRVAARGRPAAAPTSGIRGQGCNVGGVHAELPA